MARPGEILRIVLVLICENERQLYVNAMTTLWNTYLKSLEKFSTIPLNLETENLGFIGNFKNLQYLVAYRNGLRVFIEKQGPLPPCRHILDLLIGLWNKNKGGTDQYSRAMEGLHGKYENTLSPTQRLTLAR